MKLHCEISGMYRLKIAKNAAVIQFRFYSQWLATLLTDIPIPWWKHNENAGSLISLTGIVTCYLKNFH
jgi:hypothetical protein